MVVSFHHLAEREVNDATQYYELESPGLDAAFVAEVERCTEAMLGIPEAGQTVVGAVRSTP